MKPLLVAVALAGVSFGQVDVGIDTISGIPETLDSGQVIMPGAVLRCYTLYPAMDVNVYFQLDSVVLDSFMHLEVPPRMTETCPFNPVMVRQPGAHEAMAWLHCDDDTNPQNDTCRLKFFVRIKDLGLSELWPAGDTFDSGQVIAPHVKASNLGNVPLSFGLWRDSVYLPPGEDTVLYGDSIVCMPGVWTVQAFVVVVGDLHPENNLIVDTFFVRGRITVDVDARAVLSPPGVIDTTMLITPTGRFGNNGNTEVCFWAFYSIRNSGGATVYADSSPAMLMPGDSTDIEYAPIRFAVIGNYTAVCSTAMPGDQNVANDVKYKTFRVVADLTPNVWLDSLFGPRETVYAETTIVAGVAVRCSGAAASVQGYWAIYNRYGARIYQQSFDCVVEPDDSVIVTSQPFNVGNDTGGPLYMKCIIPDADSVIWKFWILPRPGVEEEQAQVSSYELQATVLRGLPPGAVAFDPTGRRVLKPKAGVYFVREGLGVRGQGLGRIRKVLLTK